MLIVVAGCRLKSIYNFTILTSSKSVQNYKLTLRPFFLNTYQCNAEEAVKNLELNWAVANYWISIVRAIKTL